MTPSWQVVFAFVAGGAVGCLAGWIASGVHEYRFLRRIR